MTLQLGDTTLGVRCDDLTVNFRGDGYITYINPRKSGGVLRVLHRKYHIILDQLKHQSIYFHRHSDWREDLMSQALVMWWTFGKYGQTLLANTAEHVWQIRPNRFGQYGRTLAEPFGSAEHSSAKKWFGSAETGFGRSLLKIPNIFF